MIPKSSLIYQPQERETIVQHSKNIYSEIFEDADDFPDNKCNIGNVTELKDQSGTRSVSNEDPTFGSPLEGPQLVGSQTKGPLSDASLPSELDPVEDWDREIQDSLAYNLVLETFEQRSHNKVYFQNQLQNLLYSYPPACQAFTKTANYESAVYSSPVPPPCSGQLSCMPDTGQFDDADEEGSVEL